ncbi:uncharacterized protein LOC133203862 [Saccostrea echinata]|uniref:uncharacterized protein LOC133203862 n=1 Tax=Saccostrea echinata TaxID=191078 RepID=UPI002A8098C0|nr:uncharacterized protein LOC133203862 [Saccostrea echinata]
MEQKTIVELRRLNSPPRGVDDVVTAFLLLLEYPPNEVKDWNKCKSILSRTGEKSVMTKVSHFDPLYCSPETAQKSEDLLAPYTIEIVRNKNLYAAKMYTWTKSMIEEVKASGGVQK